MNSLGFGENTADLVFDPLYFNVTNSSDGTATGRFNGARKTTVSLLNGGGGGGGGGITQIQSDWAQTDPSLVTFVKNKPSLATVATTGSYADLTNKPTVVQADWNASSGTAKILNKPSLQTVATTGAYSDLAGLPTLKPVATSGAYTDLTGAPTLASVATSGSYADLAGKPTIPAAQIQPDWNAVSGLGSIQNKPTIPAAQVQPDWNAVSGLGSIQNKPTIPAAQVQTDWNASTGLGVVLNKPSIPVAQIPSDWNQTTTTALDYIKNKPTIPAAQVQPDWNAVSGLGSIQNKPTIPVAQIPSDWNQTTTTALDYIKNKPALKTVATTGAYTDLSGTPAAALPLTGGTLTGKLQVDYGTTIGPSALFQASGIVANQSTSVIIGKSSTTRNSGTILWNHIGDGSTTNYLGLGYWGGDNALCVTAAGTVGIGTTTPQTTLDVRGGYQQIGGSMSVTWSQPSSASSIFVYNDNASGCGIFLNGASRSVDGGAQTGTLRNDYGDLRVQAAGGYNNATGLTIKGTSGNVGIGKNNPGTALDVAGSITTSGTLFTPGFVDVTSADPGDLISKRYASSDRYGIGQYTNGTVRVFTSGTFGGASICFSKAADDLRSGAATFTDMMTITSGGNVGIGKTNPGKALDVTGDIGASGTIYAGSISTLNVDSIVFFKNAGWVKAFLNTNVSVGPGVAFTFDGGSNNLLFTPTSSKRWTLTGVSGNYLVSARVTGTFTTATASITLRLNGTSSTSTTSVTPSANQVTTLTLIHVVYLNTNDCIEIFNTSSGTCTEYGQFQLTGQGAVSCLQMTYINS